MFTKFNFKIGIRFEKVDYSAGKISMEILERIKRLIKVICDDNAAVLELYKAKSISLFLESEGAEAIKEKLKPVAPLEIYKKAALKMSPDDATFFAGIFKTKPSKKNKAIVDDVLNLLNDSFGDPVIDSATVEILTDRKV